jgi:hypothetical protein
MSFPKTLLEKICVTQVAKVNYYLSYTTNRKERGKELSKLGDNSIIQCLYTNEREKRPFF